MSNSMHDEAMVPVVGTLIKGNLPFRLSFNIPNLVENNVKRYMGLNKIDDLKQK